MSLFCCGKTLRVRSYKIFSEVATCNPFLNARNIGSPFSPRAPTTGYSVQPDFPRVTSRRSVKKFLKASSCRTLCGGPGSQGGPKKKKFPSPFWRRSAGVGSQSVCLYLAFLAPSAPVILFFSNCPKPAYSPFMPTFLSSYLSSSE